MEQRDDRLRFFSAATGAPPYLALWHRAFAPDGDTGERLVELWFDRGNEPPLRRIVRLPDRLDAQALRMTAIYLAAVVNNTLCVWGAGRVTLVTPDPALDHELLQRVTHLLLFKADVFSDLTLLFIFALIERIHGSRLVIDADRAQAARLAAMGPAPSPAPAWAPLPGRRTVLAINVGQYKTGYGLVTLDGAGGFSLARPHRLGTWPDGQPRCYPQLAGPAMEAMRQALGPLPPEVEAVCVSLANPVLGGTPHGVALVGLCAACTREAADSLGPALVQAAGAAWPGLPVFVVNDAEAQGLFASRFHHGHCGPDSPAGYAANLLSIRLGACPSVSYLDASGRNIPRLNEYAWLVTKVHGYKPDDALLATISRYISFYGFGSIAHELGLLAKYGVEQNDAARFFHGLLTEGSEEEWRDARKIYQVLGAHVAMLAYEIHRDTPVRHVQLLGSEANQLDEAAFASIRDGFAAFATRHALPFAATAFTLAEGVSAQAGLVGAAVAYADALARTGGGNGR